MSSALKQIRSSDQPVISDFDENSFERAFDLFRPIIQGQADADTKGKLTQAEISKTVEFCFRAFAHVSFEEKEALVKKLKALGHDRDAYDEANGKALDEIEKQLTPEEQAILKTLKGRRMVRPEDSLNIDNFLLDSIDGLGPRLERGNLGLQAAKKAEVKFTRHDALSYLNGEARKAGKTHPNGDAHINEVNGHSDDEARKARKTYPNGNVQIHGVNWHSDGEARTAEKMHPNGDVQMNGVNGHSNGEARIVPESEMALNAAEMSVSHVPVDEATRHRLISSRLQSAEDLETPFDTVVRYVDAVSLRLEEIVAQPTSIIMKDVLMKLP